MNPLDLTGPEFLRFYLVYGIAILALARAARFLVLRAIPPPPLSSRWAPGIYPRAEDAYAIAMLRGGEVEAVRTLLGQLVSSDVVQVEDGRLLLTRSIVDGQRPLQPMELEAWRALDKFSPVEVKMAEPLVRRTVQPHLDEIRRQLAAEGLLAGPASRSAFRLLQLLAWLLIAGAGLLKLAVALGRGRTNVGFLILMLIGSTLAVLILLRPPRRRSAGQEYLHWLREAHHGLLGWTDDRHPSGREMALMAGIFGLSTVPLLAPLHASLPAQDPRRRQDSGSSGDSGCGSGCGSASSDSGGSGGGGGDGGGSGCGGGGCGGCGGGGD